MHQIHAPIRHVFQSNVLQMKLLYVVFVFRLVVGDPYFPGHNQGGCNQDVSTTDPPDEGLLFQQREQYCSNSTRPCHDLPAVCFDCPINILNCSYGDLITTECHRYDRTRCTFHGSTSSKIIRQVPCAHCFQTKPEQHTCMPTCTKCLSVDTPRQRYMSNCTVNYNTFCTGSRTFYTMKLCAFTTGYKWSTAFVFSLTLGGFGFDRFYLGYWREGLGKLFSFGGLGVWTMVDAVLIGVGYIPPADGSLYM